MRFRDFGKTGIKISEVGLGAWPLGGKTFIGNSPITYGEVSEKCAQQVIEKALELGVNLIDTADSYGLGRSERVIGRAIKGKRDKLFIATKACWVADKEKVFMRDVSYHNLIATCERSLRRLETEHLDFFQVHDGPQSDAEVEIFVRVFQELKKSGKARFCGASIGDAWDEGIRLVQSGAVDGIQLYYNILTRGAEAELLPLCVEKKIAVLTAVPLAQGVLTGKYQKNERFGDDDVRKKSGEGIRTRIEKSEKLKFLVRSDQTLSQAALRFCLAHPWDADVETAQEGPDDDGGQRRIHPLAGADAAERRLQRVVGLCG